MTVADEFALTDAAGWPAACSVVCAPEPVRAPALCTLDEALALELGLDPAALRTPAGIAVLAGNRVPAGAVPRALAYAGHQFAHFVPQLGDGRAVLLGHRRDQTGQWRELQLKGSGRTPFSRRGDGRAALGPALREMLVSRAMHALGIPTTRMLAVVSTGEQVVRDALLPGAVVCRVARCHVRVGSFEYFAARGDHATVAALVEFVLQRLGDAVPAGVPPALHLLDQVLARTARLVAEWMAVGFIHGVMNTDNLLLSGETLDFGPCAFMDGYDPATVYSAIDTRGRYAYGQQPAIAQWNLARLAECLLPLIHADADTALHLASERIQQFPARYADAFHACMAPRLGLSGTCPELSALVLDWLALLQRGKVDLILAGRALCEAAEPGSAATGLRLLVGDSPALSDWLRRWHAALAVDGQDPASRVATMRRVHPIVIPRNHRVEAVLQAAYQGDLAPFHALLQAVQHPYDPSADPRDALPATLAERVLNTYCGT